MQYWVFKNSIHLTFEDISSSAVKIITNVLERTHVQISKDHEAPAWFILVWNMLKYCPYQNLLNIRYSSGKKHCFTDQVWLKIITYLPTYREETKSAYLSQNQLLSNLDFFTLIPRSLPVQESTEDKLMFRLAFFSRVWVEIYKNHAEESISY